MPLTLDDVEFLQTQAGSTLLNDVTQQDLSQSALLSLITDLRQTYTQQEVHAVITMAKLRQKAVSKFGNDAFKLFFTDDALQQASDPQIRAYRAENMTDKRVLDVCCGIGSDSIAFAQAGAIVDGIDLDETRIAIAKHNAQVLDLEIKFEIQDATQPLPTQDYDLIFFDPARRTSHGKRLYNVDHYIPPLSVIRSWDVPQLIVKISPGVELEQLESYAGMVEFISVNGDLKEAVLHTPQSISFRATLINATGVHQWDNRDPVTHIPISEPQGWLCEPDPSILRANLVQHIALDLDATMIDPMIAYLCTANNPHSDWVRAWRIREWLPFNLKKLRSRLRAMNVGTVTVKKRGSPITPEELIRKLKLKGTDSATVVLTRFQDDPIAIICDDILPV